MSSAGATVLGLGYVLPVIYFLWSLDEGPGGRSESVGRLDARVADAVAAADREFHRDADRDARALRVRARRWSGDASCLTPSRTPTPTVTPTHAHHRALQHHFDTMGQQKEAAVIGMWVFLLTEILFFGGLFMAYMLYRIWYFDAFAEASRSLDLFWGGLNTAVLIGSSLTMAMAVRSAQTNQRTATVNWLILTIAARLRVPWRQGDRVRGQVRAPSRARAQLRVGVRARRRRRPTASTAPPRPGRREPARARRDDEPRAAAAHDADLLQPLLHDDRPARAPHDRRASG